MTQFGKSAVVALFLTGMATGLQAQNEQQSEPPVVQTRPPIEAPPGVDTALFMATGADALAVCKDRDDGTRRVMCFGWISGASADNGWTKSLSPQIMPDFCSGARDYSLGKRRDVFVEYLQSRKPGALTMPAIMLFREAMAAAYPCKPGTLEPAE